MRARQARGGGTGTFSARRGAVLASTAGQGSGVGGTRKTESAWQAQRLLQEIPFFAPQLRVHMLPDWETLPYDHFSPHHDLVSERLATLCQLVRGDIDIALVPVTTALLKGRANYVCHYHLDRARIDGRFDDDYWVSRYPGPFVGHLREMHTGRAPMYGTLFRAAWGKDGALYITEMAGRLLRVDPSNWAMSTVADGLAGPEGLAQTPGGKFIVAEAAKRQHTEVDPANGSKRVIASDLPIGFEAGPGLPPPYLTTGVAVAADGTVYFSADRDNGIYKIKPN